MTRPADPVLHAVIDAAVQATGASSGWMLAVRGDRLEVVAALGADTADLIGVTVSADEGSAGFVVGSGQPLAVAPRPGDVRFAEGVAGMVGRRPTSVLSVPCEDVEGAVAGALELIDKAGGTGFSFDDVEMATLLAGIAGVAIASRSMRAPDVPGPDELGGGLRALAASDPARYVTTAALVASLLSRD